MPNLKDMKKAELIVLINSQSEEIKDLTKQALGTLDPAKVTELVAEKDVQIEALTFEMRALAEKLSEATGKPVDVIPEKCVPMFYPNNEVFGVQPPPSCFGYTPELTKDNDFLLEVPESRVKVELSRVGDRLLTEGEYTEHLEAKAKIQEVLDSDDLEDDLE